MGEARRHRCLDDGWATEFRPALVRWSGGSVLFSVTDHDGVVHDDLGWDVDIRKVHRLASADPAGRSRVEAEYEAMELRRHPAARSWTFRVERKEGGFAPVASSFTVVVSSAQLGRLFAGLNRFERWMGEIGRGRKPTETVAPRARFLSRFDGRRGDRQRRRTSG